jgi:hypothetical protein
MATIDTQEKPPEYQRMLRIRLMFQLHHSIWQNDIEAFEHYWLHKNILGRIQEGRITLNNSF